MATKTDIAQSQAAAPEILLGRAKLIRDIFTILEFRLIVFKREWFWHLMGMLVFPMTMFYWSRALAPDDPDAIRRLMIGALIFGVSLQTVSMVGDNMLNDRFQGKLKLLITMPLSKVSYALGMIAYVALQTIATVALLLIVARFAGVDYTLSWRFVPLLAAMMLTMAGLTLFIATYATSAEVGSIMNTLAGILLTMISPVFFTMEQAPLLLKWLGYISPLRYAADGIMESLSGGTDMWSQFAILTGFAAVTLGFGLWQLRWQDK